MRLGWELKHLPCDHVCCKNDTANRHVSWLTDDMDQIGHIFFGIYTWSPIKEL